MDLIPWISYQSVHGMVTGARQDGGHPSYSPVETRKTGSSRLCVNVSQDSQTHFTRI